MRDFAVSRGVMEGGGVDNGEKTAFFSSIYQKNPMGAEDVPHLYTCNYVFEQCFPICDIFETNFKFEVYAIN